MTTIVGGIYTYSKQSNLLNPNGNNTAIIIVVNEYKCFVTSQQEINKIFRCKVLTNQQINDFIEIQDGKFFLISLDILDSEFFINGYLGVITNDNLKKLKKNGI